MCSLKTLHIKNKINEMLFAFIKIVTCILVIFGIGNICGVNAYADIASGPSGTCSWVIDDAGVLTISPTNGVSGTLESYSSGVGPWYSHRNKITKVIVDNGVSAASTCYNLFNGFSICTEMNLSNLDTQNVTIMNGMFRDCSSLTSLDLSNFNTSNVTRMDYMFDNCKLLTSIDVSNFNTSNVTKMEYMFSGCSKLTTLDLSNFNTSNVTKMDYMFFGCSSLTSLGVSNFNTSNVTGMNSMFYGCSSLTSLDLSNFNTSNVTDIVYMFYSCSSLISLDLSDFDTSRVTSLSNVFRNCSSLTTLDLSNFNTSNVTRMDSMFRDCSSLTSLDLSGFNTSNVTRMDYMFTGCSKLTSLDVSNFNTSNVTNMSRMFNNCSKLSSVELGQNFSFTGKNITTTSYKALLPTPPASQDGNSYTQKWIREDGVYGPYTPAELRDNYNGQDMAGTWIWEELITTYKLVFETDPADNAIGTMAQQKIEADEDGTINHCAFTKFGYAFDHWDASDGNTYEDGETIPANTYSIGDTITLTAVFVPKAGGVDVDDNAFYIELMGGEKVTLDNLPAGTSYSVYEETPDGWVLVQQSNTSGTIAPLQNSDARFKNKYVPDSASVQLLARKKLDGGVVEAGEFTFELKDSLGTVLQEKTNDSSGLVFFDAIEYTGATTKTYTISEKITNANKYIYDDSVCNVSVNVFSDNGVLKSTVTYNGEAEPPVFTNKKMPAILAVSKTGINVNDNNKDTEFTVKIKITNPNGMPLEDGSYDWYIVDNETGEVVSQNRNSANTNSLFNRVGSAWNGLMDFLGINSEEKNETNTIDTATPSEIKSEGGR